jgi:hypothetical protein
LGVNALERDGNSGRPQEGEGQVERVSKSPEVVDRLVLERTPSRAMRIPRGTKTVFSRLRLGRGLRRDDRYGSVSGSVEALELVAETEFFVQECQRGAEVPQAAEAGSPRQSGSPQ